MTLERGVRKMAGVSRGETIDCPFVTLIRTTIFDTAYLELVVVQGLISGALFL